MKKTTFDITPMGKPRIVRSDIWSGRKCVSDYYAFKDRLVLQARRKRFKVKNTLTLEFQIPMADSWSDKKKKIQAGKPHLYKPDIDNLVKAFLDSLCEDDSHVWNLTACKKWARRGKIIASTSS